MASAWEYSFLGGVVLPDGLYRDEAADPAEWGTQSVPDAAAAAATNGQSTATQMGAMPLAIRKTPRAAPMMKPATAPTNRNIRTDREAASTSRSPFPGFNSENVRRDRCSRGARGGRGSVGGSGGMFRTALRSAPPQGGRVPRNRSLLGRRLLDRSRPAKL